MIRLKTLLFEFTFPIGNDNFNIGYDSQGLGNDVKNKVLDKHKAIHNSDYGGGDKAHRSRGGHKGIDIFAPKGTPLVACVTGTIQKIGNESSNPIGGNSVNILGNDGLNYYYAHLDTISNSLQLDQRISAGDFIGTVGTTGNARGTHPHVHFSIYKKSYKRGSIDPWPYLKGSLDNGAITIIDSDDVIDKTDGVVVINDLTIHDIIDNGDNSKLISIGSEGDGVTEIQTILKKLGYDLGSHGINDDGIDGIFGFDTKSAVVHFQEDKGLRVDGIVGIETSTALNQVDVSGIESTNNSVATNNNSNTVFNKSDAVKLATELLTYWEGFTPVPIWDVNNWRIGHGSSTITEPDGTIIQLDNKRSIKPDYTITREDAARDLARRIETELMPRKVLPYTRSDTPAGVVAGLTSLVYNFGSLDSKWLPHVKAAAKKAKQTGDYTVVADLIRNIGIGRRSRRNSEAHMIETGEFIT